MNDPEHTLWCGNLSNRVTEELLYELFLQAGPLKKVTLPKDAGGFPRSYAFITFKHKCSVAYAAALFSQTKLFDRPLLLKQSNRSRQNDEQFSKQSNRLRQNDEQLLKQSNRSHQNDEPRMSVREKHRIKEPTSWAEVNALKGSTETRFQNEAPIQAGGFGLPLEPDFNMLLQMGNQMMFAPNVQMHPLALPPYLGSPVEYPSQMGDGFGNRPREDHRSHHHPYERDRYTDRPSKESNHGHPHYRRESSSSSSHHQRERRDRRH